MDDKITLKGMWSCHVTHLNFRGPNRASGTAEASRQILCTGGLHQVLDLE